MRRAHAAVPVFVFAALLYAMPASASLTTFATYTGSVGMSTDGCGSTTQNCTIQASIPTGSTVLAAYLYTSLFDITAPGGTLNGSAVTYTTALGVNQGFLQAWRADVTSIVASAVGAGGAVPFNFTVTETNGAQDGEALVVVYSNAALPTQTVGILDGFSASGGDTATINFATTLDHTAPGFVAQMIIGDGFSFDGGDPLAPTSASQVSQVLVNGGLLTNVAGHCDDAQDVVCENGNLITVGGFNDPFSPINPLVAQDHERYDLTSFVNVGDTSIRVDTLNPSNDDNIFLETFLISGEGRVVTGVPEPGTLSMLGLGLAFLVRKRWQS